MGYIYIWTYHDISVFCFAWDTIEGMYSDWILYMVYPHFHRGVCHKKPVIKVLRKAHHDWLVVSFIFSYFQTNMGWCSPMTGIVFLGWLKPPTSLEFTDVSITMGTLTKDISWFFLKKSVSPFKTMVPHDNLGIIHPSSSAVREDPVKNPWSRCSGTLGRIPWRWTWPGEAEPSAAEALTETEAFEGWKALKIFRKPIGKWWFNGI